MTVSRSGLALVAALAATGCHTTQDPPGHFPAALGVVGEGGSAVRLVLHEDGRLVRTPVSGDAGGTETTLPTAIDEHRTGLQAVALPASDARAIYGDDGPAVLVGGVVIGGPAYRAGLRRGDRIVSVDGAAPTSPAELARALGERRPGEPVSVAVKGPRDAVSVELSPREDLQRDASVSIPFVLRARTGCDATEFRLLGGLLLHREAEFWRTADRAPAHHVRFGLALNLLRVESGPAGTEVRLAWVIPIRW